MEKIFLIGFVILAVLTLYSKIYQMFDHSHCKDPSKLRADAEIVDVRRTRVGAKNDVKYCTDVYFDDGFHYETYQTDREDHFFTYKVGVSQETSSGILMCAMEAHQKAFEKAERKRYRAAGTSPEQEAKKETDDQMLGMQKEYMELYLQTQRTPLGDDEKCWNRIMERLQYYKKAGMRQDKLISLERNIVIYLPGSYKKHFEEFYALAGNVNPIVLACEQLLKKNDNATAKEIAEPYLQSLLSHPEKYAKGHYCLQSREEAILCQLEGYNLSGAPTEDNYTMFFLVYIKILYNIFKKGPDNSRELNDRILDYLQIITNLSPCNAAVWELHAELFMHDSSYQKYIDKALRYSLCGGEPYGLGAVYSNLASYHTHVTKNFVLAKALCMVAREYGGDPSVEYYLRYVKNQGSEPEDPHVLLRDAGIQVGFSQIVTDIRSSQR